MPLLKYTLTPFQRRKLERQNRTNKYGSPVYALKVAALAAATARDYAIATTWPAALKYSINGGGLDWLEIVNNDTVDLLLTVNGTGGNTYYIPASTTRTVKDPFTLFRLENLDAATATTLGLVRIRAQKRPIDADDAASLEV